jgi:hypothetical protein
MLHVGVTGITQPTKHIEWAFSFYSNKNVTPAVNDLKIPNQELSADYLHLSVPFLCGMNTASDINSFPCLFLCRGKCGVDLYEVSN